VGVDALMLPGVVVGPEQAGMGFDAAGGGGQLEEIGLAHPLQPASVGQRHHQRGWKVGAHHRAGRAVMHAKQTMRIMMAAAGYAFHGGCDRVTDWWRASM